MPSRPPLGPPGRPPVLPPRARVPESPTEVIPRIEDEPEHGLYGGHGEYGDEDDPYYDHDYDHDEELDADEQPAPDVPADGPVRKTVRTVGELFITAGLVMLLFVIYEVYVTDWISAGKQADAAAELNKEWGSNTVGGDQQRSAHYSLADGQGFAKLYIPTFGPDYKFTIVEGTTDADLEIGPGHYKGTALPGQQGNFAVAGHRVGKGAPFNDLDLLNSCDAIVIETQTDWFVYRMLPKQDEIAGWAEGKGKAAKCATNKVQPLGAPYDKTVGQEIVLPTQGAVIAPVPYGQPPSAGQQAALLTLTTCHPQFSAKERLIVHAVLSRQIPKAQLKAGETPQELKER
ncbi:class E sortase [Solihabitans fulvus]|uniref:Class E sortase n=1 Tax=Solihabitans fulvus TaxID=1892852 RepID=A0A5B2XLC8_9PSEU|nr:class E sortase [Solihabitans fulvus]KAA2263740.1 class E sortase [Solihabitans fulvus]